MTEQVTDPTQAMLSQALKLLHEVNAQTIRNTVQLEAIREMQSQNVTRAEFEPIKRIVYGAVGVALVSLLGAIIALVVA